MGKDCSKLSSMLFLVEHYPIFHPAPFILYPQYILQVHFASEHAECHRFYVDARNNFEVECITGWHLLGTDDEVDGEQDRIERQSNQRSSLDRAISPRALSANGYVFVSLTLYYQFTYDFLNIFNLI